MLNTSPIMPHIDRHLKQPSLVLKIKRDPLAFFMNLSNTCGAYSWFSMLGSPVLFLNDAVSIEYVLIKGAKHYYKGKYNDCLRPIFGDGIVLAEEQSWWKQRRDMAPAFANKNYAGFIEQTVASVEIMFKRWDEIISKGEPIDIAKELSWLTFDVAMKALYHETDNSSAFKVRQYLGEFLGMAEGRIWSIFKLPMKLALKMPKQARNMKYLDDLTAELIERRRQNQAYPEDLLSRLIKGSANTPKEQKILRDNVLSIMLGGQETTANSITWAIYELGRNTDKRRNMVQELDRVLGTKCPDLGKSKQLSYTAQVFSEILRMYAPAWTMSRATIEDHEIPLEDGRRLFVPKGTTVMLCTFTMHHHRQYWEDPECFHPERFSPEAETSRPRYAYFPFGGGPRICIGFRLAELEGLIALAMIYQRYELTLIPGQAIRPKPVIALRPDKPIMVIAKRRTSVMDRSPGQKPQGFPIGECPFAA